jgi:hypothetical protein
MAIDEPTELKGNDLVSFVKARLTEVRVNSEMWEIEYIDSMTGERWLMDYPNSGYHGGGSPRLRKLPLA